MILSLRPHDELNWQIVDGTREFEFDLGLNDPFFPLEDEVYFQALALGLEHFSKEVWPKFPEAKGILYRGSANFSEFFKWSERQEINFRDWKEDKPEHEEEHLKRLFCAEAFVTYFQMLAHKLPDEMPLKLILRPENTGTLAQTLHLLSPERFDHFELETGLKVDSNRGICFPTDERCTSEILERIEEMRGMRPVYEGMLTEQWDGLDEIYVFGSALTPQGRRKLRGFEAAGGKVLEI
jgi:hypothetical protein